MSYHQLLKLHFFFFFKFHMKICTEIRKKNYHSTANPSQSFQQRSVAIKCVILLGLKFYRNNIEIETIKLRGGASDVRRARGAARAGRGERAVLRSRPRVRSPSPQLGHTPHTK